MQYNYSLMINVFTLPEHINISTNGVNLPPAYYFHY